MVTALQTSVAWALEQLKDPAVLADAELTDAFRKYIARCESGEPKPPSRLAIRPDAIVSPHRPPLVEPPRASRFDCLAFGANCKHVNLVDGSVVSRPLPCGKCDPDREWRVFKLMVRYRHGRGDSQTVVYLSGFENVDDARKWTSSQGKRCGSPRVTLLKRTSDYQWASIIIYATEMDAPARELTGKALNRIGGLRVKLLQARPVPAEEFQAFVPREPCAEGPAGVQRITCLFTGWPDYETDAPDYLEDDGYIETGILQTKSDATPLPGWVRLRCRLPLEERAALNAGEWCEVATLADYIGPSALISDTRDWADGKAAWREAYRPMYWLLYG